MSNNDTVVSDSLLSRYAPPLAVEHSPPLIAHQAPDVFLLWQAWEEESSRIENVPFWAIVWPAASVLAGYILDGKIDVRGRRVIDIGCGAGLACIAAAKSGAVCAVANDTDPAALDIACRNAELNGVCIKPDSNNYLEGKHIPESDIIFMADMFYEKRQAKALLELAGRAYRHGLKVFIADAERSFVPRESIEQLFTRTVAVNRNVEGVEKREVGVMEFCPHRK